MCERSAVVKSRPLSPWHHDVEDDQIKAERSQLRTPVGCVRGGGDDEVIVDQIAAQQFAQTSIVVDDQDMRASLIHAGQYIMRCR